MLSQISEYCGPTRLTHKITHHTPSWKNWLPFPTYFTYLYLCSVSSSLYPIAQAIIPCLDYCKIRLTLWLQHFSPNPFSTLSGMIIFIMLLLFLKLLTISPSLPGESNITSSSLIWLLNVSNLSFHHSSIYPNLQIY